MVAVVSNDDFVAKTISNFGKAVIIVSSDLLDSPRPKGEDWGALRFAIAREIGYIAARNRDIKYAFFTAVTQSIPYLKNPLSRAEDYTADRYGMLLALDAAGDYFAVDAVSKDCWLGMSIKAFVARAGKVNIGQMVTGFAGANPPTVWRLQSLAKFGTFELDPIYNENEMGNYSDFLTKLPILKVKKLELKNIKQLFGFHQSP